jgi:nucleoside-diphosphate-sugar epimerase
MKRVLVTGASGFIGRHSLPPLVAKGYEVHGVYSGSSPVAVQGVHWHRANLLKGDQRVQLMRDVIPTHILHLAWTATPGVYTQSADNVAWLESSLHLVRLFADLGGMRIVTAGTCFEYSWEYGYCREHLTPLEPGTLYGACKHALQVALSGFSRQGGFSSAWGRIFFLYGPHEHPARLVSSVIRALLKGEPAPCSPGTQLRDFLHVEDVAAAFVALVDSEVGGAVNIGSGSPVAVRDVVNLIGHELDRSDLVKLGALPARPGEPHLLVADIRRLEAEVGFTPRYGLEDGIRETIRWWRDEADLTTVNGNA